MAPSRDELAAAAGRTVPDLVAPGLRVLFCGINPGLWSGYRGQHFAGPGNRFWPALHASGFTPRLFGPHEGAELLALGIGITNLVARTTARADELRSDELRAGREHLEALVRTYGPERVAVCGLTAYRHAFGRKDAAVGPRPERIGDARVWLLPNPSGLNAHWRLSALSGAFAELRREAFT